MHVELGGVSKHKQGGLVRRDSAITEDLTAPAEKPEGSPQRQVLLLHHCLAPGAFWAEPLEDSALFVHIQGSSRELLRYFFLFTIQYGFISFGNPNFVLLFT